MARAQIAALPTAGDPAGRYRAKEMETPAEELLKFEALADLKNWLQQHEALAASPA